MSGQARGGVPICSELSDNERHLTNLLDWRTKERDDAYAELIVLQVKLARYQEMLGRFDWDREVRVFLDSGESA